MTGPSKPEGMRPEIALSWRRSMLSGLKPDAPLNPEPADFENDSPLLRSARPVLDEMADEIAGTGVSVLLTDRDCRLVRRVVDGSQVRRRMDRLGFLDGSQFSEDVVGTSGLGTPAEVRQSIMVNGAEHYAEQFKSLSCYGHPIFHPATGRFEGILDLTVEAPEVNPLVVPFINRAVHDVEHRLVVGSRASQERLVNAFEDIPPQPEVAVAAVGADTLLSNQLAVDLLDPSDHAKLRQIAADLRPGQVRMVDIELSSGEPVCVEAKSVAGADGGTVFLIRPARAPIRPARHSVPESAAHGQWLKHLVAARATRRDEVAHRRGQTIYRVTDRLHDGRTVCVPGDQIATTVSAWLAELGAHSPLVEDLARAVTNADWSAAYRTADSLAVSVEVVAPE
ncbi:hypothetical protein [Candidatus Mycobacterium methanotrophicum]|uniref:GAF domain-containing protein n=1 Tax=Candidatus Mycobacterium methanotrophicum TaxID=2943498 RepID=A0ABY4QRZ7_9MYCO|nr:hypothetical protein [Candidatus Mycobacterium methanotrophicum]UQX12705.1 hypothetical protein M5I08_11260 [Candidatus Mycobacterium methanotrophicum]